MDESLPALGRTLFTSEQLRSRVAELGAAINADYAGRAPLVVGVLKGSIVFLADLMRGIALPVSYDFIAISSYGSATARSGVVRFLKDLDAPIEDRDVIVVEDIIDTGLTLRYIVRNLLARRPASLEVCTLLNRPVRRLAELSLRYVGFDLPDVFVVGYGLDYRGYFRNLPYIAALEDEEFMASLR